LHEIQQQQQWHLTSQHRRMRATAAPAATITTNLNLVEMPQCTSAHSLHKQAQEMPLCRGHSLIEQCFSVCPLV